jgi:undecaprenyl-phosphate 4-deoxy-4-formamido-L-arabinose transferase
VSSPGDIQLSVVIPVFDEEASLDPLIGRVLAACDGLALPFEVVLVNDGSRDGSAERIRAWQARRSEVVLVDFARNFGQHAAVTAGFAHARGAWLVTLDADLQNPPEEIPALVRLLQQGHDLVHTVRQDRQDSLFRRLASRASNRLVRRLTGIRLHDFGCMLRGYSAEVARHVVACRERRTFIPALATLFARSPVEVAVGHAARARGESKYPLRRLLALQLDLIANFSVLPLRLLFALGVACAALGVLLGGALVAGRLLYDAAWANQGTLTALGFVLILSGLQFLAFGLLGEYIGRILVQVRLRAPYVVASVERPGEAVERPGVEG